MVVINKSVIQFNNNLMYIFLIELSNFWMKI